MNGYAGVSASKDFVIRAPDPTPSPTPVPTAAPTAVPTAVPTPAPTSPVPPTGDETPLGLYAALPALCGGCLIIALWRKRKT